MSRHFDAPISLSEDESPLERAKAKLDAETRELGKGGPPKCAGFTREDAKKKAECNCTR